MIAVDVTKQRLKEWKQLGETVPKASIWGFQDLYSQIFRAGRTGAPNEGPRVRIELPEVGRKDVKVEPTLVESVLDAMKNDGAVYRLRVTGRYDRVHGRLRLVPETVCVTKISPFQNVTGKALLDEFAGKISHQTYERYRAFREEA